MFTDQVSDLHHRELALFSRLYAFPAYVKQASIDETCSPQGLPSTAYADARDRKLPVHTKAATFLSWLFFLEKRSEIHPVLRDYIEGRLTKQAEYWGIQGDVQSLREKHAALNNDVTGELPDSSFAIVWAGSNGTKERHYPLRNTMEVKLACEALANHRDMFRFIDRQVIAQKVMAKAAEFGTRLSDDEQEMLQKIAGQGLYDPKQCAAQILHRVKLARRDIGADLAQGMEKSAMEVANNPMIAMDPAACTSLCEMLDTFDRMSGLNTKYAEGLPRPEDVVFAASLTTAADFVKSACELVTGTVFTKEQFSKLALADVRDVLGSDIADAVSLGIKVDPEKMAEVASTFDRGLAQTLENLMSEAGQMPVLQHSKSASFSASELADLATVNRFVQGLPAVSR